MQREEKETRLKRKRKKEKYFINTFQSMIAVTLICETVYLNQIYILHSTFGIIMQYSKVHQLKSLFISSICFIYKSKLIKLYPRYLSFNAKIATRNPTPVFMANQEHNLGLSYTVNYQHDQFGILFNVLFQFTVANQFLLDGHKISYLIEFQKQIYILYILN